MLQKSYLDYLKKLIFYNKYNNLTQSLKQNVKNVIITKC